MTWEWIALAGLTVVALGLVVALARLRGRTRRDVAAAHAEARALRERLDDLERRSRTSPDVRPVRDDHEYRITLMGDPEPRTEPAQLDRAVFADLLLRESVIRVGSLAHGVRRALAPEARHRIRFEMRREVRRARKQRRVEQRLAYREWQARQRARVTDDDLRESA